MAHEPYAITATLSLRPRVVRNGPNPKKRPPPSSEDGDESRKKGRRFQTSYSTSFQPSIDLCGNQPVSSVILGNIAETFVNRHAIEQTRS